ncbi:MAG: NAD-dependent epimerase/dehydratase family protein [Bacilli bacterium]
MQKRNALVFGGTGLIGRSLVEQLSRHEQYNTIHVWNRKEQTFSDTQIQAKTIEFNSLSNQIVPEVTDVFIAIGTTRKKAGSKEALEAIDYGIPTQIAAWLHSSPVHLFVVSSIGANPTAASHYLRTKGRMETNLQQFDFLSVSFFRPSLLLGNRDERRFGEDFAKGMYDTLPFLYQLPFTRKYEPVYAQQVAKAMIEHAATNPVGVHIIENETIHKLGHIHMKR